MGNGLGCPCSQATEAPGGLSQGGARGTQHVLPSDHLLVNLVDLMGPYHLHKTDEMLHSQGTCYFS